MLETPSGNPEAFFLNEEPEEVIAKLSLDCAEQGYIIANATPNSVMCTRTVENAMAFGLAYGVGSYGLQELNYVVVKQGDGTKVLAQGNFFVIKSNGAKEFISKMNNDSFNAVQTRLFNLGGK